MITPPPQDNTKPHNRTIFAKDCLEVLTDKDIFPDESVDLIYLDPPFNSKNDYNLPFKGQYKKDVKPVMAFKDTWSWAEEEAQNLTNLKEGSMEDRLLADIVDLSKRVFKEKANDKISTAAYLLNMAIRLKTMRRVLKPTGSIFLHCDPTASHYLKMILDVIFGAGNFRNELIWHYTGGGRSKTYFSRKHDIIFAYGKNQPTTKFFVDAIRVPYKKTSGYAKSGIVSKTGKKYMPHPAGTPVDDVWDIPIINPLSNERLGYPTQKPLELLTRIITSSSERGDMILDPFCGCGTTLHAAEELDRKWLGIDISQFSAGLVANRLVDNFPHSLKRSDIRIVGCPLTLDSAANLAKTDPFEFEKWACGEVGAQGLFHNPGDRGADGGVDGVIPFYYSSSAWDQQPPEKTFAVVQVKGGKVTPDAVKALSTTVRESGGKCGIMICFEKYMNTVERNREKKLVEEMSKHFNFIQGLSVEDLIAGKRPFLPLPGYAMQH